MIQAQHTMMIALTKGQAATTPGSIDHQMLQMAQVDFTQELAFDEQGDGPVEGSPRSLRIDPPRFHQQLLGGEMVVAGKGRLHDHVALARPAHAALTDEFVETLFDFRVHLFRTFKMRVALPHR